MTMPSSRCFLRSSHLLRNLGKRSVSPFTISRYPVTSSTSTQASKPSEHSNPTSTSTSTVLTELKVIEKQLNAIHKNSKKTRWGYLFGALYLSPFLIIYGGLFLLWKRAKNEVLQQKNALKVLNITISGIHSSNELDLSTLLNENTSSISFYKLKKCLEYAANDDKVLGISLVMESGTGIGLAQTQELLEELKRFKAKNRNKFIICYGKSVDLKEYMLSSVCDEFYLMQSAILNIYGFSFPQLFFKNLLQKCGIKPFLLKREKYKTFGDMFVEDGMTEQHKDSLMRLGNDLFTQFLNISHCDEHVIDGAPYVCNEAVAKGLVDDAMNWNDYQMRLSQLSYKQTQNIKSDEEEEDDILFLSPREYLKSYEFFGKKKKKKSKKDKEIALINICGEIRNGESEGRSCGSDTVEELIKSASNSDSVAAILLRIDSPGGDAIASESIWNAVYDAKVNGNKPIVVSMGDICASGGYYIASAADKIYSLPATITGSIGVIMMTFSLNELLTEKLNINYDQSVTFGRNANIMSPFEYPSKRIQERYENMIDNLYSIFMKRVSVGRNLSLEHVRDIAQGKVYTGQQAMRIGLVDEIGGLTEAKLACEELAGLTGKGETAKLVKYATKMEKFMDILDGFPGNETSSTVCVMNQIYSLWKLKLWLNSMQSKLNDVQSMSHQPKPYYICHDLEYV
eukprot:47862_1